jgi:hypothetical protein
VRFRLHHPDRYGPAAAALANWAAALHDTGVLRDLTLATYRPETGRFGHGAALRAGINPAAATAAGHLGLAIGLLGTSGSDWLIDHIDHGGGAALDRAALAQAHHLHHDLPAGLAGLAVRRRSALTAYRSHLDEAGVDAALTDLLHLHYTRMTGSEADSERMCLRLGPGRRTPAAGRPPRPRPMGLLQNRHPHRLLTVDTGPLRASGSLEPAADWFTAFERAGATLKELNRDGCLTRGLRAVIAPAQAAIAQASKEVILDEPRRLPA